jgi:hypothetical protein
MLKNKVTSSKKILIKKTITTIVIISILVTIVSFTAIILKDKKINVNQYLQSTLLQIKRQMKNEAIILTANNLKMTFPKEGTAFPTTIQSQTAIGLRNKNIKFSDAIASLPIRNKLYKGPTKTIIFNNKTKDFYIPNDIRLVNSNNFITGREVAGNIKYKDINTKKPFKIQDEDIFTAAESLNLKNNGEYIEMRGSVIIINKPHLRQNLKKEERNKLLNKERTIKCEIFEFFRNKLYAVLRNSVNISSIDKEVTSEYAKLYFNDNAVKSEQIGISDIKKIFFAKNVHAVTKDSVIFADYGYYDLNSEIMILFQEVYVESPKGKSKSEIYLYNGNTGIGTVCKKEDIDGTKTAIQEDYLINQNEIEMFHKLMKEIEKTPQGFQSIKKKFEIKKNNQIKSNRKNPIENTQDEPSEKDRPSVIFNLGS